MFSLATAVRFSLLGAALAANPLQKRQQPPQGQAAGPQADVPADAKVLPLACQDSLYIAGMSAAFKQANPSVDQYHVSFKLSASENDVQDILSKNGLQPTQRYTRDYDRGFVAKLNYGQVCSLDKDPRVSTIAVCAGPNACQPENKEAPTFPGPSPNSNVPGAPNVANLPEQCAKVVWYTVTEYDAATVVPDEYVAVVKVWVSPQEALQYFSSLPGYKKNERSEANGYFSGKWDHNTLCQIEKSPLVAWVETLETPPAEGSIPQGPPAGAQPGAQPGAPQAPGSFIEQEEAEQDDNEEEK